MAGTARPAADRARLLTEASVSDFRLTRWRRRLDPVALDALARRRQHVLGGGGAAWWHRGRRNRLRQWLRYGWLGNLRSRRRRCRRALQDADGLFEGQALRPQHVSGNGSPFSDDCRQDNGAVDLPAASLEGGRGGSFQNAAQLRRDEDVPGMLRRIAVLDASDMARHVAVEPEKMMCSWPPAPDQRPGPRSAPGADVQAFTFRCSCA